jgi:hypothetical protein
MRALSLDDGVCCFGAFVAGGSFVDEVVVTLLEIEDRPGQIKGSQCCWTDTTVGPRFSFSTSQYLHIHQKWKAAFANSTHASATRCSRYCSKVGNAKLRSR